MIKWPNIGLWGQFSPCEKGVLKAVNDNFFLLDLMTNAVVLDFIETDEDLPENPADGDAYISEESKNIFVFRTDKGWVEISPKDGWRFYVSSDEDLYLFNDGDWTIFSQDPIPKNIIEAKADLITGASAGTPQRIPITSVENSKLFYDGDLPFWKHNGFKKPRVISTNSTFGDEDIVYCNATSAAFTLTFPDAEDFVGRIVGAKKTDGSINAVTLSGTGLTTNTLNTLNETVFYQSVETSTNVFSWVQIYRHTDLTNMDYVGSWSSSWSPVNVTFDLKWDRRGKMIRVRGRIDIQTAPSGQLYLSLPNEGNWLIATNPGNSSTISNCFVFDLDGQGYQCVVAKRGGYSDQLTFASIVTSTSYAQLGGFTHTIPITFASGDYIEFCTDWYEIIGWSE